MHTSASASEPPSIRLHARGYCSGCGIPRQPGREVCANCETPYRPPTATPSGPVGGQMPAAAHPAQRRGVLVVLIALAIAAVIAALAVEIAALF